MTTPNLLADLEWIVDESVLFAGDKTPLHAAMTVGAKRVAVVVGDNATGKSLLARMVAMKARQVDATSVSVSIRERTGAGMGEMSRMAQAFMFGDEGDQSTGATSIRVVQNALEKNTNRKGGCVLILDEPEMGLADGYSHALGTYIAEQSKTMSRNCGGVLVVTHSRSLVAGIKAGLGRNPTFVMTSTEPIEKPTISQWLEQNDQYDLDALLALPDINHERWRTLQDILKPKKKARQHHTPVDDHED